MADEDASARPRAGPVLDRVLPVDQPADVGGADTAPTPTERFVASLPVASRSMPPVPDPTWHIQRWPAGRGRRWAATRPGQAATRRDRAAAWLTRWPAWRLPRGGVALHRA